MKDKLIICPHCGGNGCYEIEQPDLITWFCIGGCGYTSNSQQTFSNKKFQITEIEASLPELVKDLKFIDKKGYVWYPSVINQEEKGMVFPDGTSKNNWKWSAMKFVKILEEEKEKYPKNQLYKLDKSSMKQFSPMDFIDAIDYIGFFKK